MTRNWSDLPKELLGLILDRLVLLPDYIRFGAVCKSWLCEARSKEQERWRSCYSEPPMLLIPPGEDVKEKRRLYSIWEHKLYSNRLFIPYPSRCCGSSYGWLAFEVDMSIKLFNPFSGCAIKLPPMTKLKYITSKCISMNSHVPFDIIKVILSCDPLLHPNDYVVAATLKGVGDWDDVVAYFRSEDWSWTFVNHSLREVTDVCFYQGRLYATDCYSNLIAVDLSQSRDMKEAKYGVYFAKSESLIKSPDDYEWFPATYLVELEGEIALLGRCYLNTVGERYRTAEFKVYKLNPKKAQVCDSGNTAEWVQMHNLGDFSLFLGDNESVSISASNFPNLQPNCIYYTDDSQETCPDDMGIFDLATKNISQYYTFDHSKTLITEDMPMPVPIWIFPKLRRKPENMEDIHGGDLPPLLKLRLSFLRFR